jgi:16S rRNA (adenine1518-N6/adenine1519-N6)-dimethyltransferase
MAATVNEAAMKLAELLGKYQLRPRKGLGQNFLADPVYLQKIIEAAELTGTDTVLEIGPGLGTLTRRLAERAGQVIAVELDPSLVRLLQVECADLSNLRVIEGDILATRLDQLLPDTASCKVVANLPYYITSAVIRQLLESRPQPDRLVVMVQYEVARRLVAGPGQMSLLAVSVQFYGRPVLVQRVPAGAFYPPPKVDSAIVRIDTFAQAPLPVGDVDQFFRVVKAGFSQKRKQLKNSLAAGLRLPATTVLAGLAAADIEPARRAETLTIAEWARLATAFSTHL